MPSPEEQREKAAARALQSHAASLLMGMKLEAKTECFKHSPSHCMITSLNDSLLMVVASYLDPPDVYIVWLKQASSFINPQPSCPLVSRSDSLRALKSFSHLKVMRKFIEIAA